MVDNILAEEELEEDSVSKKILHTATDGKKYNTNHRVKRWITRIILGIRTG